MSLIASLTPFTVQVPPEGVDLFMCFNPESEGREYSIARFYRKGAKMPELYVSDAPTMEERLLDAVLNGDSCFTVAQSSRFYICDSVGQDDGNCHWRPLSYNPLDCSWAVINPEDEGGEGK